MHNNAYDNFIFMVEGVLYQGEKNLVDALIKATYILKCNRYHLPFSLEWLDGLTTEQACLEFDILVSEIIPSLKKVQ